MFGISFSEIILILIISLIIFGPKQLLQIINLVSSYIYKSKLYFESIKKSIYSDTKLSDIHTAKDEVVNYYKSLKDSIVNTPNNNYIDFDNLFFDRPVLYQPELEFDKQPEIFDNQTCIKT